MIPSLASCRDINFTREGYLNALRSGLKQIPVARQMEKVYGDVGHAISYHGSRKLGNEWYTEVFLYGRYKLTMRVLVQMGRGLVQFVCPAELRD